MKLFIAPAFFSVAASYECPPGDAACQAGDEDNALLSLRASVKRHVATETAQREACDPRAIPEQVCGNGMSCRAVCPANWYALGLDSCPCDGSWLQKKATSQNNTQCNPKRGYPYTEDEPQQFCPSGLACREIPDCHWLDQPVETATCTCPASLLQKKATSYCNPQETNPEQECPNGQTCRSICPHDWEVLALESCACPDSDSHATEAPTEAPATEAPATEAPVTTSYCNPQETNPEQECPDGQTCRSICPKDWEVLALESCACPASLLQEDPTEEAPADVYCNPTFNAPQEMCPNGQGCRDLGVCPLGWQEEGLESCRCPDKPAPVLLQDEPTEEMQEQLAEHIAKGEDGSTKCPEGSKPMTYIHCAEASGAAGLDGQGNMNASPPGCYVQGGKWYFNWNNEGTGLKGKSVACMKED